MAKERLYHVLVWNPKEKDLFPEKKDRERLLKLMRKARESGTLRVYAYCLMKDRMQLACSCATDMIQKILTSMEGVYLAYCQGKYKDKAPSWEQEVYECGWEGLLDLIRYVHRMPVRAEKRKGLWYRWSSHGDYLAMDDRWADYRVALAIYGKNDREALKRYRRYIHSPVSGQPITDFYLLPEHTEGQPVPAKRKTPTEAEPPQPYVYDAVESAEIVDDAELADFAAVDGTADGGGYSGKTAPVSPDRVIGLIAEIMGVAPESLRKSGGVAQEAAARRVALYLLKEAAGLSNAETGEWLGMAASTVSKAYNNADMRDEYEGRIARIRRILYDEAGR